jgi:hypothetical protein
MDTQTAQVSSAVASLASQVSASSSSSSTPTPVVLQDTHANRLLNYPATKYPVGTWFIETDRGIIYVCRLDTVHGTGINQWWYEAGEYFAPNASHPTSTDDLTFFDNNLLFTSTDFGHRHIWVGASLEFGFANADFPGQIVASAVALTGSGWAPCNGTVATVVQGTCATTTITTPAIDVADGSGTYPVIMGGGAGTKAAAADTFAGASTTGNDSGTQIVQSGTGATVPAEPHNHPLNNTTSLLNPPGETTGPAGAPSGLPNRIGLNFYLRC